MKHYAVPTDNDASVSAVPYSARDALDEIRHDRVHGARWLTRRSAEVLLALADENTPGLAEACRSLATAQPAMAPVVRLASEAAHAASPAAIADLCRHILEELDRAGRAVTEHAAAMLRDGATVLTHSHSGTVEAALLAAHARGTRLRVIATESQPLGEGARLAEVLDKAGLTVTLIPDAATSAHVAVCSLVIVGADAVSRSGVVNKIGTARIARLARESRVPFYVVCTSDKLVSTLQLHDPEKLYDITPLDDITAVVTEDGPQVLPLCTNET